MAEDDGVIADLWTHRQTAAFLRITPGTLYVWLSKGTGPRSFKIGGSRRYDPRDVQEFLRQRLDESAVGAAPSRCWRNGDGGADRELSADSHYRGRSGSAMGAAA